MGECSIKRRRITVKYKSANPLFEQWLNEWKTEAKEKGSKLEHTYRYAISSLKKCPIAFNSGRDCKILKGFGDYLCKLLDQRLREHTYKSQESECPDQNLIYLDTDNPSISKSRKSKQKNKFVAKKSTITNNLLEVEINNIVELNDHETDTSKTTNILPATNVNQNHLLSKMGMDSHCVEVESIQDKRKRGKPKNSQKNNIPISKVTSNESNESESSNSQQSQAISDDDDFYILEPGNFDIILYIDTSETSSNPADPLVKELKKLSDVCQFEIKKLHVGDYIWICRDKTTKKELVLPYIFERKRLDDFASSIKDGRYKEQKFRLKRSGIDNKYYLIEHCQKHISFPVTSLQQAAINTAIQDGFKIKTTLNLNHTARLLNKFSTLLLQMFENKTLLRCSKENLEPCNLTDDLISLMSFKEFNRASVKNKPIKVTDLFVKMLIQIKGMSIQKALAITQKYTTPLLLKRAIDESNRDDFQKHLSELVYDKQKVGLPLGKTVVQLFTLNQFK